ncbi:MAG TPA: DUF748 domain-containing protein [Candidatus Binataceae bacterium]|jgi:outer membrane protein OmpA-like peptidoglycan-associated protein|nr:DUF748 domain-containing protein [Candidatus Binataceae bacterium]
MGLAGDWIARAAHVGRSRWLRTIVLIVFAAFAIFTLAGFFGVPSLLRYLARGRLAAALHRQVYVGTVRFNPYTLRLSAKDLLIGERDDSQKFAYVGQIRIKASWSSLYRLAPIIQELTIDHPAVHIVRTAAQRFNFSDIIETPGPPPPAPSSGKRFHFALSNIRLNEGQVWFDDQGFNEHHKLDRIQIAVPFIANLPADTEIFVQPLVRMVIDGSPFRVMGLSKPFASTPESTLDLKLKGLDLTRVAAYLAHTIPIKIPRGTLSSKLQVHFVQPESGPVIRLGGTIDVEALDVRDASNAPLVSFKSAKVALTDLEPLQQIAIVGDVGVDGLSAGLVRKPGGTTNLTPLIAAFAPSKQAAQPKNKEAAPFYLFVRSFDLAHSEINLRDNGDAAPVALALKSVHVGFKNFATNKQAPPVAFQLQAHLGDGSLALTGTLDLPHSRAATQATLDKIDLPPLQAYAQPFWAGTIVSGKLSSKAQVQTDFAAGKFNVHVQPAGLSLDSLELRAPGDTQQPVQLKNLSVALDQVDLNARRAAVKEVRLDGLRLSMRRSANGTVSLDAFMRPPQSPAMAPTGAPAPGRSAGIGVQSQPVMIVPNAAPKLAPPPAPVWQYRVASIAVENVETEVEDDSGPRPIVIKAAPLNLHLKDISNDLTKPIALEIDAALKPAGGFKIDGTVGVNPPAAKLHVVTTRIDLSPADVYLASRLNAKLNRAALTMDGDLEVSRRQENFNLRYRGNAMVVNLRMADKVTNERFLRWAALRASGIDANIGNGPPRVVVGEVALADFYARVILNSNAKLNLSDLIANPQAAPTSITHANPGNVSPPVPATKPSQTTAAAPAKPPIDANIRLGRITLQGGSINYTDNFIQPHYTADLTDIGGKIGGFGTRSTKPAEVELQGQINSSAPIDITGSVSPLAPEAFIDLKAKAEGVELTNLSPYSAKYTGYPITKGTLNVDVHYQLQNGQLTASNHLFLSQLTFGDKVPSPNAINLPFALAVSLLKNSRGEIDLTLPVSGSLNDPQFSIGALVLQALTNLILKVVASPFNMLASVVGGTGSKQNLDHVAFAAGLSTLTPAATSQLNTLAKAMQSRPGLRLTMSGRVDPSLDPPGLRAAIVDRLVKAQKVKEIRERGETADVATVTLTPDEYDKYLKLVYKQAKFDKPRNFLGLNKSLPPDEMKKLLADNTKVTDENLKELANARAVAVRRYLGKQVDPVRLAVIAPTVGSAGNKDKGKAPGVDFSID